MAGVAARVFRPTGASTSSQLSDVRCAERRPVRDQPGRNAASCRLSPALELVLDELDRELERRGHRFVRYADDCNIYVRSEKAGHRVMVSLTRFIEGRLQLQVNAQKSAVARPWQRSFLGFTVTDDPQPRRRIADKAVARFKDRVRELTRRHRGVSLEQPIADLNPLLRGWAGYFGFSQLHELASLDGWTRRRLRCVVSVQWKTRGNRYRELRRLRVTEEAASAAIFSPKGPWRLSSSGALHRAFSNRRFKGLGLFFMDMFSKRDAERLPASRRASIASRTSSGSGCCSRHQSSVDHLSSTAGATSWPARSCSSSVGCRAKASATSSTFSPKARATGSTAGSSRSR